MTAGQPVTLQLIQTHNSLWDPAKAQVTLNARCDARIVPSAAAAEGARVDYAHVAVIDALFGEEQRKELLTMLTEPEWDHTKVRPLYVFGPGQCMCLPERRLLQAYVCMPYCTLSIALSIPAADKQCILVTARGHLSHNVPPGQHCDLCLDQAGICIG